MEELRSWSEVKRRQKWRKWSTEASHLTNVQTVEIENLMLNRQKSLLILRVWMEISDFFFFLCSWTTYIWLHAKLFANLYHRSHCVFFVFGFNFSFLLSFAARFPFCPYKWLYLYRLQSGFLLLVFFCLFLFESWCKKIWRGCTTKANCNALNCKL